MGNLMGIGATKKNGTHHDGAQRLVKLCSYPYGRWSLILVGCIHVL
jgi:hypothetical protein